METKVSKKTKQLGKRSVGGVKKWTKVEMKELRSQQTATIAKVLDAMRHQLPTI